MNVYPANTPTTAPPAPVFVGGVTAGSGVDEAPVAFSGASARTYTKARITTLGTLTAHDVNCMQFTLNARSVDGLTNTATQGFTTQTTGGGGTGSWAPYQTITVSISLAVVAGSSVSLVGEIGGTGVAVPDFLIALE
jgi:hypothetical protein